EKNATAERTVMGGTTSAACTSKPAGGRDGVVVLMCKSYLGRRTELSQFCIVVRMKLAGLMLLSATTALAGDPRAEFLKMIDRPRVALAPEVREMPAPEGMYQIHFTITVGQGERVPGILLRQAAAQRRPVVIALHGTGGNKEGQLPLLRELAAKGFTAIAIDGRYHGERSKAGKGSDDYQEAMLATFRTGKGHPFLYDTVWDVQRLIDYLETRDDV